MTAAVVDTSVLAHGLIGTRRTEAAGALSELARDERVPIIPVHVLVEFGSLLRKTVTQKRVSSDEAVATFA